MLADQELLLLMRDIESDRVERKRSLDRSDIRQAICAFANDLPNYETTHAPARIYWFADRIEIYSPGGLYGHVNEQNFGQPGATDYRNPLLAEAMKVLGYVQRFGMGIPLARRELEKNKNPPPEFHFEATGVLVTIRRRI